MTRDDIVAALQTLQKKYQEEPTEEEGRLFRSAQYSDDGAFTTWQFCAPAEVSPEAKVARDRFAVIAKYTFAIDEDAPWTKTHDEFSVACTRGCTDVAERFYDAMCEHMPANAFHFVALEFGCSKIVLCNTYYTT